MAKREYHVIILVATDVTALTTSTIIVQLAKTYLLSIIFCRSKVKSDATNDQSLYTAICINSANFNYIMGIGIMFHGNLFLVNFNKGILSSLIVIL